jgi:hypothetical protein
LADAASASDLAIFSTPPTLGKKDGVRIRRDTAPVEGGVLRLLVVTELANAQAISSRCLYREKLYNKSIICACRHVQNVLADARGIPQTDMLAVCGYMHEKA